MHKGRHFKEVCLKMSFYSSATNLLLILSPSMDARMAFRILPGMNGSMHVVNPIINVLFVSAQNISVPQSKFRVVPRMIPSQYRYFCLERSSVPRPIIYAISGKERINPPVGPTSTCQPLIKFAKTGNPIRPTNIYINVERAPLREPSTMPARVTANDCIVTGTPKGIGNETCAVIERTAVKSPMRHKSCMLNLFCFIDSLHF